MKNTINIYKEKLLGFAKTSNIQTSTPTSEPTFIDVDSHLLDDLKLRSDRQQLIAELAKAYLKIEQQKNMILTLIVNVITFAILIGMALAV